LNSKYDSSRDAEGAKLKRTEGETKMEIAREGFREVRLGKDASFQSKAEEIR